MSAREENKSSGVTTTTTTVIEKETDLALCELWTSFVLGILITIGAVVSSFNWAMMAVGVLSAVGSAMLIFVQDGRGFRVAGFWVLFSALIVETLAFIALVTFGVILVIPNSTFLGFGWLFGAYALILAIPVFIMAILDLLTILKIRANIFPSANIVITKTTETTETNKDVSSMEDGEKEMDVKDASDDVSASASSKMPLLKM